MFEKEVIEIAKDVYLHHFDDDVKYPDVLNAIIRGTQRGAEFGFQKGDEWHDLRKNPQDLPDICDDDNIIITVRTRRRYERKYTEHRVIEVVGYFDTKQRHNAYFNLGTREFDLITCYGKVIAWHKLPKLLEGEK